MERIYQIKNILFKIFNILEIPDEILSFEIDLKLEEQNLQDFNYLLRSKFNVYLPGLELKIKTIQNFEKILRKNFIINLQIQNCTNIEEIFCKLKFNQTIQNLNLRMNQIYSKNVKLLADCLHLNQTIKIINLENNKIGTEGAILIAKVLEKNNILESIDLYQNQINFKGIQALTEALKLNTMIKQL